MKNLTTAVAVLVGTMFLSACAKEQAAMPAEAAPATTPTPAAESNTEDGSQTSGDKVAPRANDTAAPAG